jgi:hypothetical protein
LASRWAEPVLEPAQPDPWEDLLDHDELRHDLVKAVRALTGGAGVDHAL